MKITNLYTMAYRYRNHSIFIYGIVNGKRILLVCGKVKDILIYTSSYLDNAVPVCFTCDYVNNTIEAFINLG